MLTITLLYFAQLREQRGCEQESLQVQPGTTAAGLFQQVFGQGPLAGLTVAYALNHALVPATTALSDGDELAFLPPVGGG